MEGRARESLEEGRELQGQPDISHASSAHPHHLDLVFSRRQHQPHLTDGGKEALRVQMACSGVTQPESGEGDSTQAF